MRIVQFGNSEINPSSEICSRRFGGWLFGQPYTFPVLSTLLNYLPKFIVQNEICIAIMKALSIQFIYWRNELKSLTSVKTSGGYPTVKYLNDDLQVFINNKFSKESLMNSVRQAYEIHQKRGTLVGISEDIQRFSYNGLVSLEYAGWGDCGWYADRTFPMYKSDGRHISSMSTAIVDLDNLLTIGVRNKSGLDDATFLKTIRSEFIPILINVRINIVKARTITWNDIKDSFNIRFGNFNFGEINE